MTYTKWESELKSLLAGLPEKEIEEATRYYSEIYGDKRDAGFSDEDIIKEFGTPEECAEKIRAEASEDSENNDNSSEKTVNISIKIPEKERMKKIAKTTLFPVIPLAFAAFLAIAAILSFAASGASIAIGGAGSLVLSFLHLFAGDGFLVFLSMFGIGLAGIGLGFILTVAFLYLAKKISVKAFNYLKGFYTK